MGFPSPAKDYAERALSPEVLCGMTANTRIIETDCGYAVIEPATIKPQEGVLLILCNGRMQFSKLMGQSLITDDCEAIEQHLRKWRCRGGLRSSSTAFWVMTCAR